MEGDDGFLKYPVARYSSHFFHLKRPLDNNNTENGVSISHISAAAAAAVVS
jgi:hypothetical protein